MPTYALPKQLQQEFEQVAESLYEKDGTTKALIEAIELWLTQNRRVITQTEADINNQAFSALEPELRQKYAGKWILIAHGQLQGVAESPDALDHFAETAHHRIVVQIGQSRPKKVELGWQMTFA